jgi:hypothetical protein
MFKSRISYSRIFPQFLTCELVVEMRGGGTNRSNGLYPTYSYFLRPYLDDPYHCTLQDPIDECNIIFPMNIPSSVVHKNDKVEREGPNFKN